ncbi:hypothetical protein GIB67_029242 [Kingdonia uniflora]|uniref:Uncharacterized protein n=1 Tax=Kingdonia uniflora TaxID=39325 RepID=A0A7J7N8H3_9MAGN|nr:hypothetical protein GIB67_029242 [Kingdonia uniflora]
MAGEEEEQYQHNLSKIEEALEVKSLRRIINAYLNYEDAVEEDVRRYERSFRRLPNAHKALLSYFPLKCERLRRSISINSSFITYMLQAFEPPLDMRQDVNICLEYNKELDRASTSNAKGVSTQAIICFVSDADENVSSPPRIWLDPSLQLEVPPSDVDKCYKPILEELDRLFPSRCKDRPPCCLVPGAELRRLVLEISCLGFISQGNEFSYYMMICSSFILNQTDTAGEWTIYPWVHSNCNSLSDNDQLWPVPLPDILPTSAGIIGGFSMCGGDFVEVYNDPSHEGSWDAVVTCFFLDTEHNIVKYIEIISRILRDGGVNSEARKYKTAPLQHRDLLEKLFEGLSATGDFAWSSGMTSVPPSTQQTEYVPLLDDTNVDDTQVPHAGVDYPWEGEAIPSYNVPIGPGREPTPGSTSRTPMSQGGGQTQSKRKKPATAVQPVESSELVQSLISALTAQGSSSTSQSSDDHSFEVLRVLKDMVSSYEIDNALFFKSLKFLGGSNEHIYRMMFLGLDLEQRVSFLEALLG